MNKSFNTAILLAALSLAAIETSAQTVNKWVDEEGVTHYSDQKPVDDGAAVKQVEIPESAVTEFESGKVNERLEKQLQELEQAREAREQEAEAKERARELEEALEREPIVAEEKQQDKDRDRDYKGPFPKPPPGPFPEQFPRPRGLTNSVSPGNSSNQRN